MINKIKNYICEHPLAIIICIALMVVIILSNILSKNMEEHIEKVSKECASQGFGIETELREIKNRYGHITRIAVYHLIKDLEEQEEKQC